MREKWIVTLILALGISTAAQAADYNNAAGMSAEDIADCEYEAKAAGMEGEAGKEMVEECLAGLAEANGDLARQAEKLAAEK